MENEILQLKNSVTEQSENVNQLQEELKTVQNSLQYLSGQVAEVKRQRSDPGNPGRLDYILKF